MANKFVVVTCEKDWKLVYFVSEDREDIPLAIALYSPNWLHFGNFYSAGIKKYHFCSFANKDISSINIPITVTNDAARKLQDLLGRSTRIETML